MKNTLKFLFSYLSQVCTVLAAATLLAAHNCLAATGLPLAPLVLGITAEEQNQSILDSLAQITKGLGRVKDIETMVAEQKAATEANTKALADLQEKAVAHQKQMLTVRSARIRRGGEVSDECARFLGGVYVLCGVRCEKIVGQAAEKALKIAGEILGKAALTASDIPLPVDYSSEVVELIGEYGAARRLCTVFPLGAGTVKLPKRGTSPAFGLIAMSAAVGEKSPTITWATLAAEKWGGLIRLPSEIDEDSIVGMGQFLAHYSAEEMAKIEDVVVFTADGTATYASLNGITKEFDAAATRVVMAAGAAAYSESTLANFRLLRSKVAAGARRKGAYYVHPSFESLFCSFNADGVTPYIANGANGKATLDGFPVEWVDTMPEYSDVDAASTVFAAFGNAKYTYLGVRGGMRYDTSKEAAFETDETLVRAIERFTVGHMATNHLAVLKTGTA